ncbi:protein ROOT HAIR DEFECTIVE 3 homolog 1-like [Triticum urartu]|uniref:protein ROOT HAIR DEFECTIVE 3 homolog 1-like n=1 Tax=Triticum urartu TaxID=4572 RepID=UPI002042E2A2|nr:protein ROOT HAIR DEFECTIVE 3 homolog 1-like [Triticum urartu]
MLDVAQPTFHFYHKTEKTSEVVGAGVKKLEAAMHAKSPQEWLDLENDVQAGSVLGFGKKLGSIVEVHMEEYGKEAVYFDEAVRKAKRQLLESRILNLVQPAFQKNLSHLRTKALEKFKTVLNQSLESGKGFAASVRETTESSLSEFNQGCAGGDDYNEEHSSSEVRTGKQGGGQPA